MEEWFQDVLHFLADNHKIYSFQLTAIFSELPWRHVPIEWMIALAALDTTSLNDVPFQKNLPELPSSLVDFIATAMRLALPRQPPQSETGLRLDKEERKGMNPKKQHEVERMCDQVHRLCGNHGCSDVIDVGSGLGYLGQMLTTRFGYRVCGLESEESRRAGADSWTRKKSTNSNLLTTMTFCLKDDEKCFEDFTQLVKDLLKQNISKIPPERNDSTDCCEIKQETSHYCDIKTEAGCHGNRDQAQPCDRESGDSYHGNSSKTKTSEVCDSESVSAQCFKNETETNRPGHNDGETTFVFDKEAGGQVNSESICHGTEKIETAWIGFKRDEPDCFIRSETERIHYSKTKTTQNFKSKTETPYSGQNEMETAHCDKNETELRYVCDNSCKASQNAFLKEEQSYGSLQQTKGREMTRISTQDQETSDMCAQCDKLRKEKFQKSDLPCVAKQQARDNERKCEGKEKVRKGGLEARSSGQGVCMTGLHCCGDLTPIVLKYFVRCPDVKCLLCFGCCYHNMTAKGDETFHQFPLSEVLKRAMSSVTQSQDSYINVFALRLAAQETRTRWRSQTAEDHAFHRKNVAYRGLLELFCQQEGISLAREKRRLAHKSDFLSLETYTRAVHTRLNMEKPLEYVEKRMQQLHEEYKEDIQFIEPLTCLQVLLQPVLESLVIMDRVLFLREHGMRARPVAVFDEQLSPRNMAIVACKC